mmetsp:Transcript_46416/g.115520  ORF Transcript_46416/g.115520 Transcript_46416/m.115520 type:complete len:264 (+) Transcript_46416:1289-2080(+)
MLLLDGRVGVLGALWEDHHGNVLEVLGHVDSQFLHHPSPLVVEVAASQRHHTQLGIFMFVFLLGPFPLHLFEVAPALQLAIPPHTDAEFFEEDVLRPVDGHVALILAFAAALSAHHYAAPYRLAVIVNEGLLHSGEEHQTERGHQLLRVGYLPNGVGEVGRVAGQRADDVGCCCCCWLWCCWLWCWGGLLLLLLLPLLLLVFLCFLGHFISVGLLRVALFAAAAAAGGAALLLIAGLLEHGVGVRHYSRSVLVCFLLAHSVGQ